MLKEETDRQIDNARARVTRHIMAPGASTGFHRHDYDYVIVPVTDGRMRIVEGGREIGQRACRRGILLSSSRR